MRNVRTLFLISIVLSAFLFLSGVGIISYIKSTDVKSVNADTSAAVEQPGGNIFTPYMQDKSRFNILVLGGDKVNKNSDTMILINYDPNTGNINLMSIPRDTRTLIDNVSRKINYAYPHGGISLTTRTVSELLDVKIKYYIFLDTSAFRKIVDILGDVEINVPADMDYDDPEQNLHIHLKKGLQHLNGDQSEQYVRFREPNHWTKELRKFYDGSDLNRIKVQQNFIKELIKQKLNVQYISKLNSILDVIYRNVETNFSFNEILNLTVNINKMSSDSFNFIQLPGRPFDESPYYYICNADKAREITSVNFSCNTSFIDISDIKTDRYKGEDIGIPLKANTGKNVTENNPSNSDSSLSGKQQPSP
jgi:LCP family protein required for cell wall assembly